MGERDLCLKIVLYVICSWLLMWLMLMLLICDAALHLNLRAK